MYCVMARPDEETSKRDPGRGIHGQWTPLVCHAIFQDALEDQDIPDGQGMTASGNRRNIRCDGDVLTGSGSRGVPQRADGRKIFEVSSCANYTKKRVWKGADRGGFVEEEDLGGITPQKVAVGAAAVALVAYLAFSGFG